MTLNSCLERLAGKCSKICGRNRDREAVVGILLNSILVACKTFDLNRISIHNQALAWVISNRVDFLVSNIPRNNRFDSVVDLFAGSEVVV